MKAIKANTKKSYYTIDIDELFFWQKELWNFCDKKFSEVLPKGFKKKGNYKFEQGLGHLFNLVHLQILNIGLNNNPYIILEEDYSDPLDMNRKLNYHSLNYLLDNILHVMQFFSEFSKGVGNLKIRSSIELKLFKKANKKWKKEKKLYPTKYYPLRQALKDSYQSIFNEKYFEKEEERLLTNYKNYRKDI